MDLRYSCSLILFQSRLIRLLCKRLATIFHFLPDRRCLVFSRKCKFFNALILESGPSCSRSFPKGMVFIYPLLVPTINFSNIQPQRSDTNIILLLEVYDGTHICAASCFFRIISC